MGAQHRAGRAAALVDHLPLDVRSRTAARNRALILPGGALASISGRDGMASDERNDLRILFFAPDGLPTFRPDLDALFGTYLVREGIRTDLVTTGEADQAWGGGAALLASPSGGRVRRRLAAIANDLRRLFQIRDVSAIQVRDKPVFAGIALIAARLRGVPAFY